MEVAVPLWDEKIKQRVRDMFDTMMKDSEKGKMLNAEGAYLDRIVVQDEERINSQELFYQQAYDSKIEESND